VGLQSVLRPSQVPEYAMVFVLQLKYLIQLG
jgi:hypothetical protein